MASYRKQDEQTGEDRMDWQTIAITASITATAIFLTQFALKAIFRKLGWD